MKIEFRLNDIDGFLPSISRQLGLSIENDVLQLPTKLGHGFFTQKIFSQNLVVTYYELDLAVPSTIIRHRSENSDILPIIFWISNSGITQELEKEKKIIGKNTPNGIFFPSNNMETNYTFPTGVSIKNITIFINKKWLKENIALRDDYISNTILKQDKYFLFEEINYPMEEVITEMENTFRSGFKETLSRLSLYTNTLKLTCLYFEKILQRTADNTFINIKPHDIQNLFRVKGFIEDNYVNLPTLDLLSKESGMNERKLQKLFKQVFGKSIYQFALTLKMKQAKHLLHTREYSVSEVGYMVGYTNLSHFTRKFNAHFGMNPKTFLAAL